MKTFFQMSEQARKHQKQKLLREGSEPQTRPLREAGEQQQPASALVTAFQTAWDKFYADPNNQAAIKAMQAQKLDTKAIDGLSNTLKTYAGQLAQKEKATPAAPAPGTPATTPATATPAAPAPGTPATTTAPVAKV